MQEHTFIHNNSYLIQNTRCGSGIHTILWMHPMQGMEQEARQTAIVVSKNVSMIGNAEFFSP